MCVDRLKRSSSLYSVLYSNITVYSIITLGVTYLSCNLFFLYMCSHMYVRMFVCTVSPN